METYKVIGVMSGTSLDGVDIAYCEFTYDNDWRFSIKLATTIPYDEKWILRLSKLTEQPGLVLAKTDAFYGKYLGQLVNSFIQENQLKVDFISSHGHTIFHQPNNGFTTQIGCGANIYAETGITTINNFRVVDVALGGQGAPLVPIGDELLFNTYDACLNLGGFSNISFKKDGKRLAYDISPCNLVLNSVAQQLGFDYDKGGEIAESGTIEHELLDRLNQLSFYEKSGPKSLGTEWLNENFWPELADEEYAANNLLATLSEHIAQQIAANIKQHHLSSVLTTGGGSYNETLINRIQQLCDNKLIIPDALLIEYKESLIFAFLGVLRLRKNLNSFNSITGASRDSIGGSVWG